MNDKLDCAQVRMHFALLLYGELSFDEEEGVESHLDGCAECRAALEREKSLHAAFDSLSADPPASLLRQCRAELAAALHSDQGPVSAWNRRGLWDRFVDLLGGSAVLRPVGAGALILLGFVGAKLTPFLNESFTGASQASIAPHVSDIEEQPDGGVRIVVDETRQRTITGSLDDQRIRSLLLEAARDPNNSGLRADSVALLNHRAQSAEVRGVLVYLVGHDQNDSVRLKAMEGLKPFVAEADVRGVLSQALLSDANPGVRTQAIELLIPEQSGGAFANLDPGMIGTLQQSMLRERNESVRERCERVLLAVNASAEIY